MTDIEIDVVSIYFIDRMLLGADRSAREARSVIFTYVCGQGRHVYLQQSISLADVGMRCEHASGRLPPARPTSIPQDI
jgi:hypothetical protein